MQRLEGFTSIHCSIQHGRLKLHKIIKVVGRELTAKIPYWTHGSSVQEIQLRFSIHVIRFSFEPDTAVGIYQKQ